MSKNLSFLIVGCGKIAKIHARVLKENLIQEEVFCIDIIMKFSKILLRNTILSHLIQTENTKLY